MATPYSQDLRDRVLRAYDRGMKTKQIAETFQVSPAWARRVKQRRRESGETSHRRMGGPGVTIVDRQQLAALVQEHPDATLAELRTLLGVSCALSTLCQALKQLGLTFKKKRFTRRSEIARTSRKGGSSGVRGRRKRTPND
jgi:transposase